MRNLRPFLIGCAAVAALFVLPAQALAISPVTTDCNTHNKLTHHYSVGELKHALATMPADVKEYTSCYQIIEDQLLKQVGKASAGSGAGTSTGSSSSFVSTPVLIIVILVVVLGGGLAFLAARRGGGGTPPPTAGS